MIHISMTNVSRSRLTITTVMREYLDRQLTRFWMWLVTLGTGHDPSPGWICEPGDEERLLAALSSMNDALARAVR